MIPIEYDNSKLDEYNAFIDKFLENLDHYLTNGYIGNRKSIKVLEARKLYNSLSASQKNIFNKSAKPRHWDSLGDNETVLVPLSPMEDNTIAFFTEVKNELKDWINYRPNEIKNLSNRIKSSYPDSDDQTSSLYDAIHHMFIENGYEKNGEPKFPKDKLIEAVGTDVCPYCNRVFIKNVNADDGKQVKGQLDHFYDKDKYPYLAILKYNLIPSCPFCNGPTGKHTKNAEDEGLISPFMLEDTNAMKFSTEITGDGFTNIDTCAKAISLKVNYYEPKMENNARVFHLEELYKTHTDYAAEIYFRHRMMGSEAYQEFVQKMIGEGSVMSSNDWNRMILGFTNNPEDLGKKPISKFCKDLLEDFEDKGIK